MDGSAHLQPHCIDCVGWDDNPVIAIHAYAGIRLRLVPAYVKFHGCNYLPTGA
jgi:hypothetical protein